MKNMRISEETKVLVKDSPFNQLVLAEMERERLYQSFVLVDELDEIAKSWLEFSHFCARSLFNLTNLANLLYQRYLDELNRDKEQIEINLERREHIVKRIEGLQQFQMESAILMILYADIVNTGIFDSESADQYCNLIIEGYKVLDRISSTYFDSTHPRASSIEAIMLTFFLLNQKKQILSILEEASTNKEQIHNLLLEKGNHEWALAQFEFTFVSNLMKKVAQTWWWYDPIAIHFTYERALKHLNEAVKLFDQVPEEIENKSEEIKNKDLLINKAWKNRALIDHFFKLTLEAAKQNIFIASVEYLNLINGLSDEIIDFISQAESINEKETQLIEEIKEQRVKHELFRTIAKLAAMTMKILIEHEESEKQVLLADIQEIDELLQDSSLSANLHYLSDLPFVYQNFTQQIKIGLLENKKTAESIALATKVFERYIRKLEQGIEKIVKEIQKKKVEGDLSSSEINQFIYIIDNIKYVTYFLPQLEQKLDLVKEVETLEYYSKSIKTLLMLDSQNLNEIEDLILHAKAHYYSNKALEIAQSKKKELIPHQLIQERFNQTFVAGREVELKLFELTRQYLFLNTVIDEVARGYTLAKNPEKFTAKNYERILSLHFNYFELFEIINKQISENCLNSLEHRDVLGFLETDTKWQVIEVKKILSDIIGSFIKATKTGIMAYAAENHKDSYKSAVMFKEGYQVIQRANELLEPLVEIDESFSELAKSTYEYSLFFKELERRAREREKLQEFPLEKILSLLKRMIFFV
ncbi:MAG: hypothetical protein ACTSQE_08165 [Candidatus Heimdallarchaeaceae archaeon]